MSKFQTGDLVTLKSGGPTMTVQTSDETPGGRVWVDCKWFAGAKVESNRFVEDMLDAHDPSKKK